MRRNLRLGRQRLFTIHYSLPKLSGVAKVWYEGLPSLLYTWPEWKKKLIESFPCREDFAELLTEMLAKRVRYGESLEHYYYEKLNLLNRCKIHGKQAVDCILYAVEDRAVKVSAQAAQFSEAEQVLKYFRTVKVGHSRETQDPSARFRNDRKRSFTPNRPFVQKPGSTNSSIQCYNCNEIGHPSFRCEKPAVKCTTCDRTGHLTTNCYKIKQYNKQDKDKNQNKDKNEKQVSQVLIAREQQNKVSEVVTNHKDTNNKYIQTTKVNEKPVVCHIDLGSQCSLMKRSVAKALDLQIKHREELPILRGIGGTLVRPLGVVQVIIEVQSLKEAIDIYVVEDYVLTHPVLLGHSFTEKPDLLILLLGQNPYRNNFPEDSR